MKKYILVGFRRAYIYAFACVLFVSCTKDPNQNANLNDGTSMVVTDLAGDTTATMAGGGNFKNLYFSFATNKAIAISDEDKASLKWDLAFTGPYNAEVYVNSKGYEYNPGYEGEGKGAVIQVDQPYDQVVTAPSDEEFNASAITKIGWDAGNGTGWFFYSLDNHIAVPIQHRTFILRTASGLYAKLELLNIYKGNPPVVTDLFWPAPYLTFRYYVQLDGTHNLRTK
jgi:hypothetical protein